MPIPPTMGFVPRFPKIGSVFAVLAGLALAYSPVVRATPCGPGLSERIRNWAQLAPVLDPAVLLRKAERYLRANRLQESVLYLRAGGEHRAARKVEEQLEKVLARAEIIGTGELLSYGASGGSRVKLSGGVDVVMKQDGGHLVSHAGSEVAAYRFDRLFDGKFRVPVTVRREHAGKTYSLQAFVGDAEATLPNRTHPNLRFFDLIIDNWDRYNGTNLLETPEHLLVPIDHGTSLRTLDLAEKAPFSNSVPWSRVLSNKCSGWMISILVERCVKKQLLDSLPERAVFERFEKVTPAEIRSAFEGLIAEREIQLVLKRREALLETAREYLRSNPYPEMPVAY